MHDPTIADVLDFGTERTQFRFRTELSQFRNSMGDTEPMSYTGDRSEIVYLFGGNACRKPDQVHSQIRMDI
ncbi:hypothetical protein CEXT_684891 [Caerostris extrusa]|uniref:Uncharacterized protein n=1 Tax=Caerostris extrusa TaxID=172846 RepID=A0AAV4NZM0_CAEEX|nr:hypothetical protein CEXT_684891 [Caerostris extrusa]